VPEIVDPKLRHRCLRAYVVKHAVRVAWLDEATVRGREHQAGVTPERARGNPRSELTLSMRPQDTY
jgi:hypothetical protein